MQQDPMVITSLNWLGWIVMGALAGWLANMLAGSRYGNQGCLTNMIVGIVGAFIGGFLFSLATGRTAFIGWDFVSFLIATAGAIVLLVILRLIRP